MKTTRNIKIIESHSEHVKTYNYRNGIIITVYRNPKTNTKLYAFDGNRCEQHFMAGDWFWTFDNSIFGWIAGKNSRHKYLNSFFK